MFKLIIIIMAAIMTGQQQQETRGTIEILIPREQVSTGQDHICVVGKTDAPIVSFTLNGHSEGKSMVKDSIFHKVFHFGYGMNEIEITPIYSGITEEIKPKKMEVLYSPAVNRRFSKFFPANIFHGSSAREECTECHNYGSYSTETILSSSICYECHSGTKEKFTTHIPNDSLACLNCHSLNTDLSKAVLASQTSNPCFFCHNYLEDEYSAEFVHGPVAGGSCRICHNPHGSSFNKILNEPQETLCISCHYDIEDDMKLKYKHEPFIQGHCGICHDPHATNNKWVLKKGSEEICIPCHMELGLKENHSHPYNVKPKRKLAVDLKLADSGNLECISCHNPHASNTKKLLRITNKVICFGCHPDR